MTIERTIEIPASRRIFLDLPPDLPVGKARVELTVIPETKLPDKNVKPLRLFLGIHKDLDTMDAYFVRKYKDKALEDTQFERNSQKAP